MKSKLISAVIALSAIFSASGKATAKVRASIFNCEPNRRVLVCVYNGKDNGLNIAYKDYKVKSFNDILYYARIACKGQGKSRCKVVLRDDHQDCIDGETYYNVHKGDEKYVYRKDGEWHMTNSLESCKSQN